MIKGKDTNKVYLSELLLSRIEFQSTFKKLLSILDKHQVDYSLLKDTQDIWCRDYMPIQKSQGEFIQFRYEPYYLKDYLHLQSDTVLVNTSNSIKTDYSNINLDGGNVVNWDNRAIITDRIFDENLEYTDKTKLINELEHILEVEVIIIPQIKSDITGHADGMVRFIDQNRILGNDRQREFGYWKNGINRVIKDYQLEYIDIPFFDHKNISYPENAFGCYVNFLEVNNLIVLPIFEIDKIMDYEVYDTFKLLYPDREIETINYNEVGKFGGLLNCTTWTIFE